MLSPPFRLKKPTDEILLGWLSCLPDSILNTLPLVEKNVRDTSRFIAPRKSYDQHSVGTIARILRLRRALRIRSAQLSCPVLTIIDPLDHHLSKSATDIALTLFPKSVLPMHRFLPGGEHELSIGPRGVAVQKIVEEFMFRALDARISKDPTDAS